MCREGQIHEVKAWIIGNPNFCGDAMAINMKNNRGELEYLLHCRLTAGDFTAYRNMNDLLKHKKLQLGETLGKPIEIN